MGEKKVSVICADDMDSSSMGVHGSVWEPLVHFCTCPALVWACHVINLSLRSSSVSPPFHSFNHFALSAFYKTVTEHWRLHMAQPSSGASRTWQLFSLAFAHQANLGLLTNTPPVSNHYHPPDS